MGKVINSLKKLNYKAWILAGVVFVGAIFATVFLLKSLPNGEQEIVTVNTEKPKTTMDVSLDDIANQYFEEHIRNSEKRMDSYTLVVKNLKKMNFDTSDFDSYECSDSSYVVIRVDNPAEINGDNVTYTTETTAFDCKS